MGVSYFYDQSDETDKISLNGKTLKFRVLNAELHIANTPATFTAMICPRVAIVNDQRQE